jgi:large subunit ribosomal protein L13
MLSCIIYPQEESVKPANPTPWIKPDAIPRRWILVDARGIPLGRLCSRVATLLRGKHRPEFAPHWDLGDYVIVVNAREVKLTGRKLFTKLYARYSGYPGGMRVFTARDLLQRNPERLILEGVWGMLPKNRLGRKLLRKLRVYPGPDHPHKAQKPITISL